MHYHIFFLQKNQVTLKPCKFDKPPMDCHDITSLNSTVEATTQEKNNVENKPFSGLEPFQCCVLIAIKSGPCSRPLLAAAFPMTYLSVEKVIYHNEVIENVSNLVLEVL